MPDPSPYLRLRQICLVAPQLAPAVATVEAVLGLPVCYRDPNVAKFGLENALFALGSSFLEIVAPLPGVADTAAERFIARSGGQGGYMLIFDWAGLAAHWAALMDVAVTADAQGGQHLALDFGAVCIRPAPAGTPEHLATLRVAVGDPAAVLAAAALAGCTVQGGRFQFAGVAIEPVAAGA
ncbi:MAG: hypothetical protein CFE45_13940 [Burkholderiales bacterium PBB5]|nr:MAG: hypothetical protein CFE45_13940 [Burkholderiales bacterium PBB5]